MFSKDLVLIVISGREEFTQYIKKQEELLNIKVGTAPYYRETIILADIVVFAAVN